MEYFFNGDWNEKNKEIISNWINAELTELQGEVPEVLFLEYIIIMIGNGKSMKEIAYDLKDFFGEESRNFADQLGAQLQQLGKPPAISEKLSLQNDVIEPIKVVPPRQIPQNTRLLQSAIRSSTSQILKDKLSSDRGDTKRKPGDDVKNITQKKQKPVQSYSVPPPVPPKSYPPPPQFLGNNTVAPPSSLMGTLGGVLSNMGVPNMIGGVMGGFESMYLEQMNQVAKMYGFASSEEMVRAQQAQMLAMMSGLMPPPAQNFAPSSSAGASIAGVGSASQSLFAWPGSQQSVQHPPPPPTPPKHTVDDAVAPGAPPIWVTPWGRGRGRGSAGGRGRGRGGRAHPHAYAPAPAHPYDSSASSSEAKSPQGKVSLTMTKALSTSREGSASEDGSEWAEASSSASFAFAGAGRGGDGFGRGGGRGRGRGRGIFVPAAASQGFFESSSISSDNVNLSGNVGGEGGRGRGGRGRGGRGLEGEGLSIHKKWVRPADLTTSLVTGR